jgi:predicted RecA/RadA family phage recombinase
MAKNQVYPYTEHLAISEAATDPATPASGDPVLVGQIPGVALTAERADGTVTIATDGVWSLSVKGIDGGGNSAVAVGDIIYYVTGDTPKLSKKATGVRFGYARGTVGTGATATIPVQVGY